MKAARIFLNKVPHSGVCACVSDLATVLRYLVYFSENREAILRIFYSQYFIIS